MGSQLPERAGWSVAPEIGSVVSRQKEQCDEMLAQIRSGTFQPYYLYTFGKIERIWAYVEAVARKANKEAIINETIKLKKELIENINQFNSLQNQSEDLDILEIQRLQRISFLDGRIIDLFMEFYEKTLDLGVSVGLFSFQKGGDWYPSKTERGQGVSLVR